MHLGDADGNVLELRVTGYQFPTAQDPRLRYSWHMIAGSVVCAQGAWEFEWQALTCDESPLVAAWLRSVADWADGATPDSPPACPPPGLDLTEPNLSFAAASVPAGSAIVLHIGLDLEFKPPWKASRYSGDPYLLAVNATPTALRIAADDWDTDLTSYPDLASE